ncbi:hypothetical protein ABFX02_06G120000 [Erythranthe guttata]
MFHSQNDNGGVVLFNEGPSILISDEQDKILEELLADYATEVNTTAAVLEENNNVVESKKSAHRDIERQRRQEMSLLYASLRSLLPLEYVKGKRAVSDHMHQAVNYIKHMQKKIEEMRIKRDELNKLSNNVSETREDRVIIEAANSSPTFCVKINICINGGIFEILISSSSIDKGSFSPSKVFDKLLQRGLNVISFVSTRVDKLFLHKIQIEENDFTSNIDLTKLEEELVNVMKRV